jgi:hypothetical protein
MASVFGPVFLSDLRALTKEQRGRVAVVVREIENDPKPDGVRKREAPPPFKPGMLVAVSRGFAVRYSIEPAGLRFYRVQLLQR